MYSLGVDESGNFQKGTNVARPAWHLDSDNTHLDLKIGIQSHCLKV